MYSDGSSLKELVCLSELIAEDRLLITILKCSQSWEGKPLNNSYNQL